MSESVENQWFRMGYSWGFEDHKAGKEYNEKAAFSTVPRDPPPRKSTPVVVKGK